jgi:hypothetical protein
MTVWITYFADCGEWFVDKVFDTEEKAKKYTEFKDQMTGDTWSYFSADVE